jgi:hypothetical protein
MNMSELHQESSSACQNQKMAGASALRIAKLVVRSIHFYESPEDNLFGNLKLSLVSPVQGWWN